MIDLAIEQHMEDLPSKRARQHFLQQYSLRKRNAWRRRWLCLTPRRA